MFRKFEISDSSDGKLVFECHGTHPTHVGENVIVTIRDDIAITLHTRKILNEFITIVNDFMSHNTIDKVEVVEIEE